MKIKGTNISIALLVLGIMAVAIIAIRLTPGFRTQEQYTLPSFEEFSKNYIPSMRTTESSRKASLGDAELLSQQVTASTFDGQSIQMYVSKPEGEGPFPVVVMVHDGPSSAKVSREMSLSLGEAIMQQYQVIAVSVDRRDSTSPESEIIDIAASLSTLEEYKEVDVQSVALLGDGVGAHMITQLLQVSRNTQNQTVDGVLLLNPYSNPASVWEHQRAKDEKESSFFPAYFGCSTTNTGTIEVAAINACLVAYTLQTDTRITVPMTIVTTSNNNRVPEAEATAVAALAQNSSQVTMETITTENSSGNIIGALGTTEMDALLRLIDPWMSTMLESWNTTIIPATGASDEVTTVNTNATVTNATNSSSTNETSFTLPKISE